MTCRERVDWYYLTESFLLPYRVFPLSNTTKLSVFVSKIRGISRTTYIRLFFSQEHGRFSLSLGLMYNYARLAYYLGLQQRCSNHRTWATTVDLAAAIVPTSAFIHVVKDRTANLENDREANEWPGKGVFFRFGEDFYLVSLVIMFVLLSRTMITC